MNIADKNVTNDTREKLSEILRNSPEGKKVIDERRNYIVELDELAKNVKVTLRDKTYTAKDIIVAKSSNTIDIVKMIDGIDTGSGSISEDCNFVDIYYSLKAEGLEHLFKHFKCNSTDRIEFYTTYHKDGKITASIMISKADGIEQPKEIVCYLTEIEKAFFKGMIQQYWYTVCLCTIEAWMDEMGAFNKRRSN